MRQMDLDQSKCFIKYMFEQCKKIEIFKIQNHYHYYLLNGGPIARSFIEQQKIHALRPKQMLNRTREFRWRNERLAKKGFKLGRSGKEAQSTNVMTVSQQDHCMEKEYSQLREKMVTDNTQLCRSIFQCQNEGNLPLSQQLIFQLYDNTASELFMKKNKVGNDMNNIQKIENKTKPTFLHFLQNKPKNPKIPTFPKSPTNFTHLQLSTPISTPPNPNSPTPISLHPIHLSNIKSTPPQKLHQLSQLFCYSLQSQSPKSPKSAVSKSVSQAHVNITSSNKKWTQYTSEEKQKRNSINSCSLNISHVIQCQQLSERKKKSRQSILNRLTLFHDSDHHTIQSRLSQQRDPISDTSLKIQQSIVEERDPRLGMVLVRGKELVVEGGSVVSLAVVGKMNLVVSLKEFGLGEMGMVVRELQAYELVEKGKGESGIVGDVLGLYYVQLSDTLYLLIKQPYTALLYNILQQMKFEDGRALLQVAKQVCLKLLNVFAWYGYYPTRKITSKEFVVCVNEIKFHDLSVFLYGKEPFIPVEEVVEGLDC